MDDKKEEEGRKVRERERTEGRAERERESKWRAGHSKHPDQRVLSKLHAKNVARGGKLRVSEM